MLAWSSVPAVHAAAKGSTISTSPLTPGTSAPCSRSARTSASTSGTTESRRSYGGVRLIAPRTSPSSSSQPKYIGASPKRWPARSVSMIDRPIV